MQQLDTVGVTGFLHGLRWSWRGLRWLLVRPKWILLLLVPWVLGLFLTLGSWLWLFSEWHRIEGLFNLHIWAKPEATGWLLLYYPVLASLWLGLAVGAAVSLAVLLKIVLLPVYEKVSWEAERSVLQDQAVELRFWAGIRTLTTEFRVVVMLACLSVLTLLPFLGLFAWPLTAYVAGVDACNFPLARRQWPAPRRWQFARQNISTCIGIGIPLTIPLLSIMLSPIVIVGGTLFACERLRAAGSDKRPDSLEEE